MTHPILVRAMQPLRCLLLAAGLLVPVAAAQAGPIAFDTWLQFSFDTPGAAVAGCAPADPAGGFCVPSFGTPTSFLDAPAWTFNVGAGGATLTVSDVFESGDLFQVFDFGALIGTTSAPAAGVDCGDDPVVCAGTAGMSTGVFALGAGAHALTLVSLQAPGGPGTGYLFLSGTGGTGGTLPEPGSLALVLAAGAALRLGSRGKSRSAR